MKAQIKALLKTYNAYWHCPVQNGMGDQALDFMHVQVPGCPTFAIEAKKPGGEPTERQWRTIRRIRAAGGTVFIIDGDTSEMESWLHSHLEYSEYRSATRKSRNTSTY